MDTLSHFIIIAAIGSVLFSGCERVPPVAVENLEASLSDVQANIFNTNCAVSGCHASANPQLGQDLSAGQSFANVVNVQSVERPDLMRVAPGDPENSYLFKKLRGDQDIVGARMPLGRTALSEAQMTLVENWILEGALDN